MKRLFTIAVLAAAGMVPLAQAQQEAAASAAPSAKVAVIAFQAAVAKTNEGQTNFAELEKKYQPKQESINSLKTQVDTLTKQLQADGPKLTDVERAARAKTIDDKTKELDRAAQEARTDFQQEIAKTYGALAEKVYGVLQAYAQQNGYTLGPAISGALRGTNDRYHGPSDCGLQHQVGSACSSSFRAGSGGSGRSLASHDTPHRALSLAGCPRGNIPVSEMPKVCR